MRGAWIVAALALVSGCASFEAYRTSVFTNDLGQRIWVEYGKEEHESTFVSPATGKTLPYKTKNKVRVTLEDGRRFTAFQVMSPAGMLYKPDDGEWEFFEEGAIGLVAERAESGDGYELRFRGVYSMEASAMLNASREKERKAKKVDGTSSTPSGFGRASSGPRDSSGPRTVE